jgi:hypothetical protein
MWTIGGGANTRYFDYTGPASRASIRYSEAISEELGLSVNISHQSVGRSYESIGITYDVADFGRRAGRCDRADFAGLAQ